MGNGRARNSAMNFVSHIMAGNTISSTTAVESAQAACGGTSTAGGKHDTNQ